MCIAGKSSSILSSLSSVARKSSQKWYQKFTDAGEFQKFEAPIQLPQTLKLSEGSAVVEEYGWVITILSANQDLFRSKLVHNFNNLFENLKYQSPLAFFSEDPPPPSQESPSESSDHESLHSQMNTDQEPADPTVIVKHKTHYKRVGRSSISKSTNEQTSLKGEGEKPPDVCADNLDKLLGGLCF